MVQEQRSRSKATHKGHDETEEAAAAKGSKEVSEAAGQTIEEIDDVLEDLLDEELLADIDNVLEHNAEEFVSQYVQQGGE